MSRRALEIGDTATSDRMKRSHAHANLPARQRGVHQRGSVWQPDILETFAERKFHSVASPDVAPGFPGWRLALGGEAFSGWRRKW